MSNIGAYEDVLEHKSITDISKLKRFTRDDPQSIFEQYYTLGPLVTYFRRGDYLAYQDNFIPIWLYSILFDSVLMYIPPRDEEWLKQYYGINLDQLRRLIEAGLVTPLIGNNLDAYSEKVFGPFVRSLPEDKPLIRAQLFEDCCLEGQFAFERRVQQKAKEYEDVLGSADAILKSQYLDKRKQNPTLMPELEKLPYWVAERVVWQELCVEIGKLSPERRNIEAIEKAVYISPLQTYIDARTLHYIVVPIIYARGGIPVIAWQDEVSEFPSLLAGFPYQSKGSRFGKRADMPLLGDLHQPERGEQVDQIISMIISISKQPRIRDDVKRVLLEFKKVDIAGTGNDYGTHSEKLSQAIDKTYSNMAEYLSKSSAKAVLPYLAFSTAPHIDAFVEHGIDGLVSGLMTEGDILLSMFLAFILARGLRGRYKKNKEEVKQYIKHELEERLKPNIDVILDPVFQTPFLQVRFPNPLESMSVRRLQKDYPDLPLSGEAI